MTDCILSIGGSDTWGGGGIATDLKTFDHWGYFGLAAITCLAVKDPSEGFSVLPIELSAIEAQLRTIQEDIPLAAIKIGLLHQVDTIHLVADFCLHYRGQIPIVLDPVMAFKEGDLTYQGHYLEALRKLIPLVDVITPNFHEGQLLSGHPGDAQPDTLLTMAEELYRQYHRPILLKGQRQALADDATDLLYTAAGPTYYHLPYLKTGTVNGAGCCLSAALASALADQHPLKEAAHLAKQFTHEAIQHGLPLANNSGNVYHPCPKR